MACRDCPYNSEIFWRNCLKKTNIWQGSFCTRDKNGTAAGAGNEKYTSNENEEKIDSTIYINSTIVDNKKGIFSYDWANYPDAHATLGFIQYVFLPTFYYSLLNRENRILLTPIQSQDALVEELEKSRHPQSGKMIYFLRLAQRMWPLCSKSLPYALLEFCRLFNNSWYEPGRFSKIDIYMSTEQVAERLSQIYWCDEVLYEETGMIMEEINSLCSLAEFDHASRILLVHFLNHNLGCLA